jgi:hypothetical protein
MVGAWMSLRWTVPGVDTAHGAGTMMMRIDRAGDATIEFDPEYPLYAITETEGAVRVRMNFAGSYNFRLRVGSAQFSGGNAQVTSYAELGGQWIQIAEPIDLTSGGVGHIGGSQFICEDDRLVIRSTGGGEILFTRWP